MAQYIIYGDSILKGVTNQQGIFHLYHSAEELSWAGLGLNVENRCRMGAGVKHGTKHIAAHGAFSDDTWVILEYGGNDADHNWAEVAASPDDDHKPHVPIDQFCSIYRQMIDSVRDRGGKVAIVNLLPMDADRYFRWITRNQDTSAIRQWLGAPDTLSRYQEYYNRAVETIAAETGCPLIDLRSPFLTDRRFNCRLGIDGIHPTPEGHELLRKPLTEFMKSVNSKE